MATTAAGTDMGTAPVLVLGRATRLRPAPTPSVHFPAPPGKRDATAFGRLATVQAATAGTVRVALGGRAWIDVAEGGTALASTAHAHGAPCSGVAKTVEFPLTAGSHVIEISGSEAPTLDIRLSRRRSDAAQLITASTEPPRVAVLASAASATTRTIRERGVVR